MLTLAATLSSSPSPAPTLAPTVVHTSVTSQPSPSPCSLIINLPAHSHSRPHPHPLPASSLNTTPIQRTSSQRLVASCETSAADVAGAVVGTRHSSRNAHEERHLELNDPFSNITPPPRRYDPAPDGGGGIGMGILGRDWDGSELCW